MVLVPIYLNEIAPKSLRGAFGVTCQVFVVIGIAIAQFLSLFLSTIPYWRVILLFGGVIGATHFVLLLFAVESPKWVALQPAGQARASVILRRIRGEDSDHEVRDWRRRSLLPTDNEGVAFNSRLHRCRRSTFSVDFCVRLDIVADKQWFTHFQRNSQQTLNLAIPPFSSI
jgi:MFS family permease